MVLRSLTVPALALVLPIAAAIWSVTTSSLPPADFTFNNDTEIESVDPAIVTGQPEGRIIEALYEGLVRLDPRDRTPTKLGAARDWSISDDQLVYTFTLRNDARWSNGDAVTAYDYHYSLRRFLNPLTGAQYAYQAWYIKNAKRFTLGTDALQPGDHVEVELNLAPHQHDTCIGSLLKGTLVDMQPRKLPADTAERRNIQQKIIVDVDGVQRSFVVGDPRYGDRSPPGSELCRQVTLDFAEVGVRVVDRATLEMTLAHPTPYWLELLGFYPLYPVHRGCLERYGAPDWTAPENLVCNGPYTVELRRPRDRIRLRRNPQYWNGSSVRLQTIDALAIEDTNTSLSMYEAGQVDWITQVDGTVMPDIMQARPPRVDFDPGPQMTVYYYKLNTTRKPFNDVRVRRALALALDRQEIIRTVTRGPEAPATHLVPPGIPGYQSPTLPNPSADRARQLLTEAGFPGGRGFPRLEILYNTHEQHEAMAEMARKQWQRELGITITLQNEVWPSVLNRMRQKEYDIARQSWTGDYIDPNTWLDMYVTDGENNQTGWSNAEYDRCIDDAMSTTDAAQRLATLARAEAILMEELPIVPIYFYVSRNLVKPHVFGWYTNLQDAHPLHALWIDRAHPRTGPMPSEVGE